MADRLHELVYGLTGQTFAIVPPEAGEGIPSSVSCKVYRYSVGNDGTEEFTATTAVESIGTAATATVDQASGVSQTNRRRLYLDSTSSIAVGGQYLLVNALGQARIVTPILVAANDYVDLDVDLDIDAAVGATLKGVKLTATVDATWVATEDNISRDDLPPYRVAWTYTIAGAVRKHATYLRLVRQTWKHNVTVATLRQVYGSIDGEEDGGGMRGIAWPAIIDFAAGEVRNDIELTGRPDYHPHSLRDTERVDMLVAYRALWNIGVKRQLPGNETSQVTQTAHWKERYLELFARCFVPLKVDVSQNLEGSTAPEPYQQPTLRR